MTPPVHKQPRQPRPRNAPHWIPDGCLSKTRAAGWKAALATVPVASATEAIQRAAWWLCGRYNLSPANTGPFGRICSILERVYGVDEEASDDLVACSQQFLRVQALKGQRPPMGYLKRNHPHFVTWWGEYRAGLCWRVDVAWRAKQRAPNPRDPKNRTDPDRKWWPWSANAASIALKMDQARLSNWLSLYDQGKLRHGPPESLQKGNTRRSTQASRRAKLKGDIDHERRTLLDAEKAHKAEGRLARATGKLERMEAGVDKTAAGVSLIPRKRRIAALSHDSSVRVMGGQLVLLSAFAPHPGQQAFLNSGARFRFAVAGIRGGKTRAGAEEALRHAIMVPGSHGWLVGPTYGMQTVAVRALLHDTILSERPDLLQVNGKRAKSLHFANGSVVEYKSAEWEETLRGPGLDWIWIDECQLVKASAYKILVGRTSDTLGRIWGTGTPLGRSGWVFREFAKGQNAGEPDHASFRFPSRMNPMVADEEVERARRTLPAAYFRQEYEAEFVEGVSNVFRNLGACIVEYTLQASGTSVVIGLDLARKQDFTVALPVDHRGNVLGMIRMHHDSWTSQKERILALVREHDNATVIADAAGPGDPVVEDLINMGVHVVPMNFNSANVKRNVVEQLILDIEAGHLAIPASNDRLLYELAMYRRTLSPGGAIKYHAPDDDHDDCVIALACANWGLRRMGLAAGVGAATLGTDTDPETTAPRSLDDGQRRQLFLRNRGTGFAQELLGIDDMRDVLGQTRRGRRGGLFR